MGKESLSKLLNTWETNASKANDLTETSISLFKSDLIRITALSQIYKLPEHEVIASLLHEALNDLEATMPYVEGDKVIRVEDGEEIYEDVGPMPKYLAAQKNILNKAG